MVALRKIYNESGVYSISTAVPIDSVVKNTDPYISYGAFYFACVQQSWTTLAGVSPVTVIALSLIHI